MTTDEPLRRDGCTPGCDPVTRVCAARCPNRARDIYDRILSGHSLKAVGEAYEVTRERIRQIARQADPDGPSPVERRGTLASRRAAERTVMLTELGERVRADIRQHGTGTAAEVAARLGVIKARDVTASLGPGARRLLLSSQQHGLPRMPDDEVLAALRAAATTAPSPMSGNKYDTHRPEGALRAQRIIIRYGSWNAALAAAGLPARELRRSYDRQWGAAECVAAVRRYLADPSSTGAYDPGYCQWAQQHEGEPSGPTVRNSCGGWAAAKTAAISGAVPE